MRAAVRIICLVRHVLPEFGRAACRPGRQWPSSPTVDILYVPFIGVFELAVKQQWLERVELAGDCTNPNVRFRIEPDETDLFKNGSKGGESTAAGWRLHEGGHAFTRKLNGHHRSTT